MKGNFFSYFSPAFVYRSAARLASYPNPADEGFKVEVIPENATESSGNEEKINITIFDETGNFVRNLQSKSNDIVNTKDLKEGIYYLHFTYPGKQTEMKRIVVKHQ